MQMHEQMIIVDGQEQPISRTYQYRKVMKPMLERKRRARINRCLDELKDLMVTALAGDGENVAKLEKADILELTVRHLHKLQRQQRLSANPVIDADRFRAGYTHCANEVSRCLAATPGVDVALGTKLMTHLGHKLNAMDKTGPLTIRVTAPPPQPSPSSCSESSSSDDYSMPLTPASSQPSPIARTEIETTTTAHQGLLQVAKANETPFGGKKEKSLDVGRGKAGISGDMSDYWTSGQNEEHRMEEIEQQGTKKKTRARIKTVSKEKKKPSKENKKTSMGKKLQRQSSKKNKTCRRTKKAQKSRKYKISSKEIKHNCLPILPKDCFPPIFLLPNPNTQTNSYPLLKNGIDKWTTFFQPEQPRTKTDLRKRGPNASHLSSTLSFSN